MRRTRHINAMDSIVSSTIGRISARVSGLTRFEGGQDATTSGGGSRMMKGVYSIVNVEPGNRGYDRGKSSMRPDTRLPSRNHRSMPHQEWRLSKAGTFSPLYGDSSFHAMPRSTSESCRSCSATSVKWRLDVDQTPDDGNVQTGQAIWARFPSVESARPIRRFTHGYNGPAGRCV